MKQISFRRLSAILLLFATVFMLTACAKPGLDNYVFEKYGPFVSLVDGPENLPKRKEDLTSNRYKIAVGSVTSPNIVSPLNFLRRQVATVDVDDRCSHRAFSLNSMKPKHFKNDKIKYSLNFSTASPEDVFSGREALSRDFPEFPSQFIGYIDYVEIRLKGSRLYRADEAALKRALDDIKKRDVSFREGINPSGRCPILSQFFGGQQVTAIFVSNFEVDALFISGVAVGIKDKVRLELQKSYIFQERSDGRIYAIITRPVPSGGM